MNRTAMTRRGALALRTYRHLQQPPVIITFAVQKEGMMATVAATLVATSTVTYTVRIIAMVKLRRCHPSILAGESSFPAAWDRSTAPRPHP